MMTISQNYWRSCFTKFRLIISLTLFLYAFSSSGFAQVNSGSDGSDGVFNPTATNTIIDMADHPDGIYQYVSVNIPSNVTVSFIPNANNSPVVWLVRSNCVINGKVDVSGKNPTTNTVGAMGGPGGYYGGNGGSLVSPGQGPGGGTISVSECGGGASYATLGLAHSYGCNPSCSTTTHTNGAGAIYGNQFLIPLIGGSGGGANTSVAGGGGGGAILIVASGQLTLLGSIIAKGGGGSSLYYSGTGWSSTRYGGSGSGGGVRLVTSTLTGNGTINANGGAYGGLGRVRFDVFQNNFGGTINGDFTQGFQPIIIPASGQGIQLAITSVAGISVSATPSGVLLNPDVIIPGLQVNPIPVVVHCSDIPLNTEIIVEVRSANGEVVEAVGLNNVGTQESSTATVSLNMPRGGGIIFAKAVTGIAGDGLASFENKDKSASISQMGWTADGERITAVEVTATLGGPQALVYLTESGKRYSLPRL